MKLGTRPTAERPSADFPGDIFRSPGSVRAALEEAGRFMLGALRSTLDTFRPPYVSLNPEVRSMMERLRAIGIRDPKEGTFTVIEHGDNFAVWFPGDLEPSIVEEYVYGTAMMTSRPVIAVELGEDFASVTHMSHGKPILSEEGTPIKVNWRYGQDGFGTPTRPHVGYDYGQDPREAAYKLLDRHQMTALLDAPALQSEPAVIHMPGGALVLVIPNSGPSLIRSNVEYLEATKFLQVHPKLSNNGQEVNFEFGRPEPRIGGGELMRYEGEGRVMAGPNPGGMGFG